MHSTVLAMIDSVCLSVRPSVRPAVKVKVKADIALHGYRTPCQSYETSLAIWITQCYLPPDTNERAPPNTSHAGWYSIYLPRRDGRLSWLSWLDSTPAGSRTSDLSSPTPNRCTTKITCLSQSGIMPKLLQLWSCSLHWRIAPWL